MLSSFAAKGITAVQDMFTNSHITVSPDGIHIILINDENNWYGFKDLANRLYSSFYEYPVHELHLEMCSMCGQMFKHRVPIRHRESKSCASVCAMQFVFDNHLQLVNFAPRYIESFHITPVYAPVNRAFLITGIRRPIYDPIVTKYDKYAPFVDGTTWKFFKDLLDIGTSKLVVLGFAAIPNILDRPTNPYWDQMIWTFRAFQTQEEKTPALILQGMEEEWDITGVPEPILKEAQSYTVIETL